MEIQNSQFFTMPEEYDIAILKAKRRRSWGM